jgi:ATP-dependent DNA helicase RecG
VEYHDDLEGSLISTADKVVDLIYLKYLKAKITYEHDRRVETYPFARNAIREAIYNAIAHNCYMYGTPIQIRIEEEQIIISNRCILPEGWTAETLMQPHDSIPYNPDIANVFYRAGYIETWGQGIQKICDECIALGTELPRYEILGTGMRVYFPALKSALIDQPKPPNGQSAKSNGTLDGALALKIIDTIRENSKITIDELSEKTGIARRTLVRYMNILQDENRIVRVGGKRYGHWQIND